MDVLEARVVLRERSVLDSVDLAVRFVVTHAKKYALVSLAVLVPAFAASWLMEAAWGWGWAWTASIALAPFAAAPFTALASRLLFEPSRRARDAIRAAASVLPALVGMRLLQAISVSFAMMLLVVPAFVAWTYFFYANEVMVLERSSVGAGLGRLPKLLVGQGGDTVLAVLFLTALHIVAVFLGDAAGRSVLEDLLEITPPPAIVDTKGSVLGLAAFWAFVPFGATCRFLVYVNARTRTEGWDVQTSFAAITARANRTSDAALEPKPSLGRGEAA